MYRKVSTIFFILTLLAAGLIWLPPVIWFLDWPDHFVIQFSVAALILSFLYILRGKFFHAGILVVAIGSLVWPVAPYIAMSHAEAHDNAPSFTVLHANVNYTNTHYDKLHSLITEYSPDIITLNEVSVGWAKSMDVFLAAYPYRYGGPSEWHLGMYVLSKIPIASAEVIEFEQPSSPTLMLHLNDPELTFYAVHPLSPSTASWTAARNDFMLHMQSQVASESGRYLLVGDFNNTVYSSAFRSFLSQAQVHDARRGHGLLPTWLVDTPFAIPIDHVLLSDGLEAPAFEVLADIGSDHRPILATIQLTTRE